jgi:hypothetical protein
MALSGLLCKLWLHSFFMSNLSSNTAAVDAVHTFVVLYSYNVSSLERACTLNNWYSTNNFWDRLGTNLLLKRALIFIYDSLLDDSSLFYFRVYYGRSRLFLIYHSLMLILYISCYSL